MYYMYFLVITNYNSHYVVHIATYIAQLHINVSLYYSEYTCATTSILHNINIVILEGKTEYSSMQLSWKMVTHTS